MGDTCSFGGAGDWDDVMLAVCLRDAGVVAADTEDAQGRAFFLPVEPSDVESFGPPRSPSCEASVRSLKEIEGSLGHVAGADHRKVIMRYYYWRHRIFLHIRCYDHTASWASPYPVNFHFWRKDLKRAYEVH